MLARLSGLRLPAGPGFRAGGAFRRRGHFHRARWRARGREPNVSLWKRSTGILPVVVPVTGGTPVLLSFFQPNLHSPGLPRISSRWRISSSRSFSSRKVASTGERAERLSLETEHGHPARGCPGHGRDARAPFILPAEPSLSRPAQDFEQVAHFVVEVVFIAQGGEHGGADLLAPTHAEPVDGDLEGGLAHAKFSGGIFL